MSGDKSNRWKGAHRIMKAVTRMFYEMNMDMRLAKEEDLLPLFELTNDRMVRQNSFSTHAISLDEHRNWFYATLKKHRSMYSYVRLSIDRCTATYV